MKAHAEEKQLVNQEITQVLSKAEVEALAFQVSLRKEQMRIHWLEKTIEQKTKEKDELTRISDDLTSKMERIWRESSWLMSVFPFCMTLC